MAIALDKNSLDIKRYSQDCIESMRRFLRTHQSLKLLTLGSLTGWMAWGSRDAIVALAWIVILPMAWGIAESRISAAALMAGYYLSAARGLIEGTKVFFGEEVGYGLGVAFWLSACLILTAPFFFLWSKDLGKKPWLFILGVIVSIVPPFAIVGWVNPLSVAGVFFPGLGWMGLILTSGLFFFLTMARWRWVALLSMMALVCNSMSMVRWSQEPPTWRGVDTMFPALSSGGNGDAGRILASMERVQWIKQFAKNVPSGHVWVLPETVAGVVDAMSKHELQQTEADLKLRKARLLVGAELPQDDGQYKNVIIVLGADKDDDRTIVQNIPVPFSMWKPWTDDGAIGSMFGRGNLASVMGFRVSGVVCYEQLLMYSWLWTMWDKPDVLAAVSNVWWARDTSIPAIQLQMTHAMSRLFGVGVIIAKNG